MIVRIRDKAHPLGVALVLLLLLLSVPARAAVLSAEALDHLLAPVALYPDSVLGDVLVGATWPDQVVEANQWLKAREPSAEPLSSALAGRPWDRSVQALCSLPDVLAMMAGDMTWTKSVGRAFVDQPDDVYDSIQRLRARARTTGALQSTGDVVVQSDDAGYILVGSSNPEVVYVPTYEPAVVYGWTPGAVVATTALAWGTVQVLDNLFYGACWDWHAHRLYMGPGYGACGYYNGRVNVWGGNTINVYNDVRINNVQANLHKDIVAGNTRVRIGTEPGQGRWNGHNGYERRTTDLAPGPASRPPTGPAPGPPTRPPTRPAPAPVPAAAQTHPSFDASRLSGSGSGLTLGSGSQARRESQRGAQARASQASWAGGAGGAAGRVGGGRRR